jgi:GMP synthase (glutamine-hydrolysing)
VWSVIQHVAYDGRGGITTALQRTGRAARDCRPFRGEPLPSARELSGLIVLGAPGGAADADQPAHLPAERQLIREVAELGKPVLGVCFGSQLVAVALGGGLVTGGPLHIGMGRAALTEAGRRDPLLAPGREALDVLHWHRDTYTRPSGAVSLATSFGGVEQAFRYADHVYALLFHVEIDPSLADVIAEQMPPGSLPPARVAAAADWGGSFLDRFLGLA